jgi:hypothetical protein
MIRVMVMKAGDDGDGMVDSANTCVMVDYWETDEGSAH